MGVLREKFIAAHGGTLKRLPRKQVSCEHLTVVVFIVNVLSVISSPTSSLQRQSQEHRESTEPSPAFAAGFDLVNPRAESNSGAIISPVHFAK